MPIKTEHASWAEFKRYLEGYTEQTYQLINVAFTSNVEKRNRELAESVDGKRGRAVFILLELEKYKHTYICTRGWKTKPRGSGARPRQKLRYSGCRYGFTASVFRFAINR